ncbi:type VI secretion system baseplate subunit TssG [Paraburkholderia lycopersici]|uniref:Type VI secretion system protein ImpH n=1 Tax=Paraburkholderia lycopersici TaxID=416944 RepID=A0A1G6Q189_9BURK|nr:type VI secretion system baseplate subunit TssG [Paraburkholderia lycopersici]SDC85684.1 type VI secretion system protein ImpH [Paraburkholderia lycopersici]
MERESPKTVLFDGILSPALLENLRAEPWRYGFIPVMRRIGANRAVDPVGTAALPDAEPFRMGQRPSLVFAPREIADAFMKDGKLHMRLFGLGMLGPNGPLPIHVTEIAREREEHRRDATLSNFLDIFHHRSLTLLYRAWATAQSAASLDRPGHDRFSLYVASLSGYPLRHDRPRPLPAHARLSAAPLLAREARNPEGLGNALAHYFGVPVRIDEYVLHWMTLAPENCCVLGQHRASSIMGSGAVIGTQVPDRQYRFRMVIGPLDIEDYHRFTPRGTDLLRLIDWVRAFVSEEYDWELELQIKPQSAPPAVLGGPQQLGWSAWMGQPPSPDPVTGMRFEPEGYVQQLRRNAARQAETR